MNDDDDDDDVEEEVVETALRAKLGSLSRRAIAPATTGDATDVPESARHPTPPPLIFILRLI